MAKIRWLSVCLFLSLVVGCSHNVPLRHGLKLSNPPNPKLDKKILIVMPSDQAELLIRHKPDPLADTYVFEGGTALKDTLLDVLGQIYRETSFTNTNGQSVSEHDLVVEVDFKSWNIKLNIYTGNVVKLGVNYTIRDSAGKEILKVPTSVSSKDRYTGGELAGAFLVGAFYNISKMKESSGSAWDQATANSVGMLLDKLLAIEKDSGT